MGTPPRQLDGLKVIIGSRCAWSLYNFRRNLIRAAETEGADVLALGGPLHGFEHRLTAEGYRLEILSVPETGVSLFGDIRLVWELVRVLRRERPDVVHFFTIKPAIYGTLAAALTGVPKRLCTITGAGHAFTEGGGMLRFMVECLYKLALRHAHLVIFQNADDREMFVARGLTSKERTALTPGSGVDLVHFARRPHQPGLGERPVRFLVVSRLLKEKGLREFIEAVEVIQRKQISAQFTLIGALDRGNPTVLDEADVSRLAPVGIEWIGHVNDVRPYLQEADVVVLPSYREGAPRALLEAMAIGRPIITTDAVGCRSVVQDGVNGFMVPVKDVMALAAAMERCAREPWELALMGHAARSFVEDHFDEAEVISATLRAYAPRGGCGPVGF